ncbi:hypothetical protein [Caldifermentibacillus hisashii]|uniref:hypothetical protein n=1 Tax=Caldifermentibacillus hisashii TaxID=996558 RepID=UPI0030E88A2F
MMYVLIDDKNGVSREYHQVERKAKAGDYIVFTHDRLDITANRPYKVEYASSEDVEFTDDAHEKHVWDSPSADYSVFMPTDFVHIDGERYRMVDRKAKVGEKVIVVDAKWAFGKYENGSVVVAEDVDEEGIYNDDVKEVKRNEEGFIAHEEYRVLEPAIQAERVEPVLSTSDLIANLAKRVVELERRLSDINADVNEVNERIDRLAYICEQSTISIARDVERIDTDVERLKQPATVTIDASVLAKLVAKAVESE